MERLVRWCAGSEGAGQASRQTTPTFHDPPPSSILELLEEERAVYSQGVCVCGCVVFLWYGDW